MSVKFAVRELHRVNNDIAKMFLFMELMAVCFLLFFLPVVFLKAGINYYSELPFCKLEYSFVFLV